LLNYEFKIVQKNKTVFNIFKRIWLSLGEVGSTNFGASDLNKTFFKWCKDIT